MIDLKDYGYKQTTQVPEGLLPGRVTEHQRDHYKVVSPMGDVTARLKGAFIHTAQDSDDFPCVGDFVLIQYNPIGDSLITNLLPRESKFSRADYSGHKAGYAKTIREQLVAANFDYVFILSSLNADFNVKRIARYVTQAQNSGGWPVVILTKADLADDTTAHRIQVERAAPGVMVHSISSHTGQGMEELADYLQPGKTIVFLGMSGVGKSSLLNALMHDDVMAVSDIREDDSRGRHTTTHRQLFMLPSGAMVIDTPGMRELGLFGAEEGISQGFQDVEALFADCRFNDCQHETEPGCAVRAAIKDGSLPLDRWTRYQQQLRENQFVEDKAAYMRNKEDGMKSIALYTRSRGMKK